VSETTTRSLQRALDVIECFLGEKQDLTLKDIREKTALSVSTVHRLINALEKRDYLIKDEKKRYHLGGMIAKLGYIKIGKVGFDFKITARKYMLHLQQKYNESVSLYIIEANKRLCIDRVESTHHLRRVIDIGSSLPLGIGAAGKVLIANLSQDEVDDMYLHVNIDSSEYELIRELGYSHSEGERELGVSALAVPIFNFTGKVVAAISISGPTARFDKNIIDNMIMDIKEASKELSRDLGYNP
jgi:DNA-binding IclR family transcriptional regulator